MRCGKDDVSELLITRAELELKVTVIGRCGGECHGRRCPCATRELLALLV